MAFPQVAKVIVAGARGSKGLKGDAGADLGNVTSTIPTSAVTIDADMLASRVADIRDWAGIDLTGAADCTAIFQDAVDTATAAGLKLILPAGTIRLTAPIVIPSGCVIEGVAGMFMTVSKSARTMLHFDHAGKGFTVTGFNTKATFRHFGTKRSQPVPAPAYAPGSFDWDFELSGVGDCFMDDILLMNPTKGIVVKDGGGRHTFNRIWGQPLTVGIQIDTSLDVTRISDMHFWNFWSSGMTNETDLLFYMINNATALYSKRNDNPEWSKIFSIFYRHGIRIGNFEGITTKRLHAFGVGVDACGSGLTIDADVNGATLEFHGFYAHGNDSVFTTGSLVENLGTNNDIRFYGKTDLTNAHRHAINNAGSGTGITAYDTVIGVYNLANGGYAAVNAASGSFSTTFRGEFAASGGVSGAALFSGTGRINGVRRDYTPTITPGTGSWTGSPSSVVSQYLVQDGICEVQFSFTQPTNNTGAGSVSFSLPITANASIGGEGLGRETAINGNMFQVAVLPSATTAGILTPTNGYPGVTNGQFRGSFRYRV